MIVTLKLMVVIFLGWLQPKKYYLSVIFGLPYSNIALRPLKNAHPVRSFRRKHIPTQLHFIPLSPSTPLQNGVLISCNGILPQSGGTVILSFSSIILLKCLHLLTMVELQHFLCSITSSLNSESHILL
jgi:hypothetical protein